MPGLLCLRRAYFETPQWEKLQHFLPTLFAVVSASRPNLDRISRSGILSKEYLQNFFQLYSLLPISLPDSQPGLSPQSTMPHPIHKQLTINVIHILAAPVHRVRAHQIMDQSIKDLVKSVLPSRAVRDTRVEPGLLIAVPTLRVRRLRQEWGHLGKEELWASSW
jgi:hypothetical protein